MGGKEITEIQKSGLFDSVDEKGVLVKSEEQRWGFRSYSKHWGEKGTYDTTQCLILFAKTVQHLGLTSQNVLILVPCISYSISSHCVLTKF